MTYINVRAHARMSALVHKPDHFSHGIQKAEAEWLQFERDVDFPFRCIIAEAAAGLDAPLPLRVRWNHFALPDVFAKHQQNIPRAPIRGEVDEFLRALDVKFADGFVEIDEPDRNYGQRDNREVQLFRGT